MTWTVDPVHLARAMDDLGSTQHLEKQLDTIHAVQDEIDAGDVIIFVVVS